MRIVLDVLLMTIGYRLFFYNRWKESKPFIFINSILYIYICMVLLLTVLPIPWELGINLHHDPSYDYGNLIPFHDILLRRGGAIRDVTLNIIMLIPFGFLIPLSKNKKLLYVAIASFLFSLSIESSQLLMTIFIVKIRSFDITDLISNTVGGIIGYQIYIILNPVIVNLCDRYNM